MPTTPSKAQQEAEAAGRANGMDQDALIASDRDVPQPVDDNTGPDQLADPLTTRTPIESESSERRPPVIRSPKDDVRDEIAARFRKGRTEEAEDESDSDAAQIRRFAKSGMPPELAPIEVADGEETAEETVVADAAPPDESDQPAPKRKLKVLGRDIELTEDELVAAAQKSLAADNYLDEARQKLHDVNALLNDTRQRATHVAPPPAANQGQPDDVQPTETGVPTGDGSPDQTDPFTKLIETIQYGDPKEAAASLQKTLWMMTNAQSKEVLFDEHVRNDLARSQKVLAAFMAGNPDIANDTFASSVIERQLFELQKADLTNLGYDESRIPQSPAEIARMHLQHRVRGFGVRDPEVLLNQARADFLEWHKPSPAAPAASRPAPTPKVTIAVDRQQRRAAIPQQPTRSGAPRPDNVVSKPPARDRSDIVQQMKIARGAPRQQVLQ